MRRSLASCALLVLLSGAGWSCSAFGADGGGAPDASTSDASADAALDAPRPDAGGAGDAGPGSDAGPTRGPRCTGASTFCATTQGCCFQLSAAPDACVDKASPCTPATAMTSTAFLSCTDRESCPGALPFCCLGLGPSNVATGSTCQPAACAGPQLCAADSECKLGTCVGLGGTYSLDSFQTYCK